MLERVSGEKGARVVKDVTRDTLGTENGQGKHEGPVSLEDFAQELRAKADAEGIGLVGPDGLLASLTKTVLETALDAELTDHLGYERHERTAKSNARNGTSPKTVHTDVGPVDLEVPRDRAGTFEPKIVPKHARRIGGFDEAILSLYAKGPVDRGDRQAPGRHLRRPGLEGDDLQDHRRGQRRGHRVAEPAAGCLLPGDLHRCDRGQDPRRGGRQPADLRGDGDLA